jgi:hypothetical protein
MREEEDVAQFKVLYRHLFGGSEENNKTPQDSQFVGRDLNPGLPQYEAGVLMSQSRHSVESQVNKIKFFTMLIQIQ